ncbi:hypothetical protein EUX98_g8517 [Antrodiella citrinella]|uniref:Cytochrome P450 n=1 Tax=Antrodiella citrinella TaxID=2447956 RepID=A0A4S4M6K3_9APHY|nr:hypothetical protein EUX98_g8517 [Antrodiella citrinella]
MDFARAYPLVTSIALVCLAIVLLTSVGRKERPAPMVNYWLPWIGSAIALGRDPDAFFEAAKQECGPVFRVKAVGKDVTYVTSSEQIQIVYRDTESFISPAAYCATGKALYGTSYPAEQTMKKFQKFDSVFHIIAAGCPLWLLPSARSGWNALIAANAKHVRSLRQSKEKLTDFMSMVLDEGEKHAWSDKTIANILAISVWATESNTTWAIYWTVAFLLQHCTAQEAVLAELNTARATWVASHPDTPLSQENFSDFMQDSSDLFPLLTSSIQESVRLRSSSFSVRRVGAPIEFAGYHHEMGDRIICNTRAVHMDEALYETPTEYIFDRFTEAGKKRASELGKSASPPFLPFGGGVSVCEGRYVSSLRSHSASSFF